MSSRFALEQPGDCPTETRETVGDGGGGGGGGLDDCSPGVLVSKRSRQLLCQAAVRPPPSGRLSAEGFNAKCSEMVSQTTSVESQWVGIIIIK